MNQYSQLFYGLDPHEIGRVVYLTCFNHNRELKRAYKQYLIKEFSQVFEGFSLAFNKETVTVIHVGQGSSKVGDAVLALQGTACEVVVYSGAAGGIGEGIAIGDLMLIDRAMLGDGFSRYYKTLDSDDVFKNYSCASSELKQKIYQVLQNADLGKAEIQTGDIYTIESLFAETKDFLLNLEQHGIRSIDMETAAFLTAAEIANLQSVALHYISDLPQIDLSPNIFNGKCKRIYLTLPYLVMEMIEHGAMS